MSRSILDIYREIYRTILKKGNVKEEF